MTEEQKKILIGVGIITAIIVATVFFSNTGLQSPGTFKAPPVPIMPRSPDGLLHFLSGKITAVGNGEVTVSAVLPGNKNPQDVIVAVDASTNIVLQKQKDPAMMQKEMQEFQSEHPAATSNSVGTPPPTPPMPFTEEKTDFNGLQTGMFISITPVDGTKENATEIRAVKIIANEPIAMPSPPLPAVPPPTLPPTR